MGLETLKGSLTWQKGDVELHFEAKRRGRFVAEIASVLGLVQ